MADVHASFDSLTMRDLLVSSMALKMASPSANSLCYHTLCVRCCCHFEMVPLDSHDDSIEDGEWMKMFVPKAETKCSNPIHCCCCYRCSPHFRSHHLATKLQQVL